MVVVAIMAIVLAMGVPLVYQLGHKEPMRKATADLVELFSNARAQAILQNTRTEVVFRPHEGTATLGGGSAPAPRQPQRGDEMPAGIPDPRKPCARFKDRGANARGGGDCHVGDRPDGSHGRRKPSVCAFIPMAPAMRCS